MAAEHWNENKKTPMHVPMKSPSKKSRNALDSIVLIVRFRAATAESSLCRMSPSDEEVSDGMLWESPVSELADGGRVRE